MIEKFWASTTGLSFVGGFADPASPPANRRSALRELTGVDLEGSEGRATGG